MKIKGILLSLILVLSCESTPEDTKLAFNLLNEFRLEHGLAQLGYNLELALKADSHAQFLRDTCTLEHAPLLKDAPRGWLALGENVGRGGSIEAVQEGLVNSPTHREQMLGNYRVTGIGIIWGTCNNQRTVFVVQEFMR